MDLSPAQKDALERWDGEYPASTIRVFDQGTFSRCVRVEFDDVSAYTVLLLSPNGRWRFG